MKEENSNAIIGIIIIIVTLGILVLCPYLSARSFNKLTSGHKATYWDAFFTQLRVTSK